MSRTTSLPVSHHGRSRRPDGQRVIPDPGTGYDACMSETESEQGRDQDDTTSGGVGEVGDDQLPEELQPTEDNPLARHPGQTGDEDDAIGQDREGGPETAPLDADQADYGSGGDAG